MRPLIVLGVVLLLCGAGAAQCVSYFPNAATFPFSLAITTQVTFTFTNPNGTVSGNSYSIPGTVLFPNPRDQAAGVFGANGDLPFQACNNVFPTEAGTVTNLATNVPQRWLVTVTINSSGGSMSISESTQNTVVNADGACPSNCSLDNIHGMYSYQYNIATGAYTISFQGNRHFLGVDPNTGIQTEQVTQTQGSASGVWPVTIIGAGLIAVIRGTPNTATIVMTPSIITSTEAPYPIGPQLEPITIECQDTSGNTVPNCKADFDYDVIEGSGGHVHNTDRPTGTFASNECSEPFVRHISCNTGTRGVAVLTYAAPEASGITETANGTVSANGQSSSFSFTINVLYGGLELASGSGLIIDTASRNHGNNNGWASPATNEALNYMASLFSDTLMAQGASVIPVIEIDAISLPLGGLFDYEADQVGHNWLPPHISHRFGNNADVCIKVGSDCSHGLTNKQRKALASVVKYAGFRRIVEATHWHLIGPY